MNQRWMRPAFILLGLVVIGLVYRDLTGSPPPAEPEKAAETKTPYENWRPAGPVTVRELPVAASVLNDSYGVNTSVEYEWYYRAATIWLTDPRDAASSPYGNFGKKIPQTMPTPKADPEESVMLGSLYRKMGLGPEKFLPERQVGSARCSDLWKDPLSTPATGRTEAVYRSERWRLKGLRVLARYNVTPYIADYRAPDGTMKTTPPTYLAVLSDHAVRVVGDFDILPTPRKPASP